MSEAQVDFLGLVDGINTDELVDMTETVTGGGSGRGLLPTGVAFVRLAGYIELGNHAGEYQGKKKDPKPNFKLVFKVVGGGGTNLAGEDEDFVQGEFYPTLSTYNTELSQHEKARAVKLLNAVNIAPKKTHFIHKLGQLYTLPIAVKKSKDGKRDVQDVDFTNLQAAIDPITRKSYVMPELTKEDIQVFLWNKPSTVSWEDYENMWNCIHIEGEWEAQKDDKGNITKPARSKNYLQEECLKAVNFAGSDLEQLIARVGGAVIPPTVNEPEDEGLAPPADDEPPVDNDTTLDVPEA